MWHANNSDAHSPYMPPEPEEEPGKKGRYPDNQMAGRDTELSGEHAYYFSPNQEAQHVTPLVEREVVAEAQRDKKGERFYVREKERKHNWSHAISPALHKTTTAIQAMRERTRTLQPRLTAMWKQADEEQIPTVPDSNTRPAKTNLQPTAGEVWTPERNGREMTRKKPASSWWQQIYATSFANLKAGIKAGSAPLAKGLTSPEPLPDLARTPSTMHRLAQTSTQDDKASYADTFQPAQEDYVGNYGQDADGSSQSVRINLNKPLIEQLTVQMRAQDYSQQHMRQQIEDTLIEVLHTALSTI